MNADDVRTLVDEPHRRGEVTAVEFAEALLQRIEQTNERLRALITTTPELAAADARRADECRVRHPLPLDGLPLVLKDNVDVAGVRTTVGSRLFAERPAAADDAPAVRLLREAGAVILGKANLQELAFGATSANETFGAVANPWSPERIPGGSSGGSGAAVAADLCVAAIGTDTGGSVRLPAAMCGVAGLRPTYGAAPLEGIFPVSPSLDTVGPLARSARDVAAVAAVLADAPQPGPADDLRGLRVGRLGGIFLDGLDQDVERATTTAAEVLEGLGASVVDIELAGAAEAVETCGALIKAEALRLHERDLRERPELFEEGTRRRLALAAHIGVLDQYALVERMLDWQRTVRRAFASVDVLLAPTIPCPTPSRATADTVATTGAVVPFTHALSLAWLPSLSLPAGLDADGLPIGVQIAGAQWSDDVVLGIGAAFQRETDWHRRRPPGW